jgi:hypothetical protein
MVVGTAYVHLYKKNSKGIFQKLTKKTSGENVDIMTITLGL